MTPLPDVGRIVIGIGGIAVACGHAGQIITHALGSCLGVTMWDARLRLGGMLHAQLPTATPGATAVTDAARRGLYVDQGMALLLREMERHGSERRSMRLCVAGGASLPGMGAGGIFSVGQRNLTALRKVLWQERLLVAAEETGGSEPRTMTLDFTTGAVQLSTAGRVRTLT